VVAIRNFRRDDFFPIAKLIYETFPERYDPQLIINLFEFFPEGFLIAEENNKIIGFLAGVLSIGNRAKILLLGVEKEHRNKGIGSLLLRRFIRNMALKGIRIIELEVDTSNKKAVSFYKKNGFVISKIVKNFYRIGDDAYLMVKHL